jgi:hypothetical protein
VLVVAGRPLAPGAAVVLVQHVEVIPGGYLLDTRPILT